MKKGKWRVKVKKSYNFAFVIALFSFSFFLFNLAAPSANAATISKPMQSLGLVGFWSFDVGKGTASAFDLSGQRNNGTLTNMDPTAAWVAGKIGNALNFDGVDDHASTTDSVSIRSLREFTYSAWIYPRTLGSCEIGDSVCGAIAAKVGDGIQGGWRIIGFNDTGQAGGNANSFRGLASAQVNFTTAANTVDLNAWQHVVFTVSEANDISNIYKNGVLLGSQSFTGTLQTDTNTPFSIGSTDGGDYFDGAIDEVRIYNRALSADEIKRLYRQTSSQFNASQANKLRQGLVGMWTFDGVDMGTTSAIDRSGNGNTGWLINGPKKAVGRIGQALSFDGVDDYVNAGSASSLKFANGDSITISAWIIQPNLAVGTQVIANMIKNSSDYGYALRVASGYLNFIYRGTSVTEGWETNVAAFTANQWTHVAITYTFGTGSSIVGYVNGVSKAGAWTATGNDALAAQDGPMVLGQANTYAFFKGSIDDVRVYNRALTEAEIKQLYKASSSFHPNVTNKSNLRDGLVGHWSFDGNDMGTTSAIDASGNANTGWLVNGPEKAAGRIGQALNFDGVNDYVLLSNTPTLTTNSSVSFWMKTNSTAQGPTAMAATDTASAAGALGVFINTNSAGDGAANATWFQVRDSSDTGKVRNVSFTNASVYNNTWHHFVLVRTGSNTAVYYDATQPSLTVGANTLGTGDITINIPLTFGARNLRGVIDSFAAVNLDEVRIYNRALTEPEIKRLYNMGR